MSEKKWVVWSLHWRYHSSTVDIDIKDSKADAFRRAAYLEDEAEDCVNEVVGIENPDGHFIDLAEYRATKPEITRARRQREEAERAKEKAEARTRLTITGPEGHVYTETWTDKYLDKYREKYVGLFGAERVRAERLDPPSL
jgi:hypothetical protein